MRTTPPSRTTSWSWQRHHSEPSSVLFCKDFREVDSSDIAKFGDAYRDYMERVPGWNPVAGVWRWIREKTA